MDITEKKNTEKQLTTTINLAQVAYDVGNVAYCNKCLRCDALHLSSGKFNEFFKPYSTSATSSTTPCTVDLDKPNKFAISHMLLVLLTCHRNTDNFFGGCTAIGPAFSNLFANRTGTTLSVMM